MSIDTPEPYEEEDAIGLIDLLLVFAHHKWKIIGVPVLVGCVTAAYSLKLPEIYTASTTLIPSDRKQSSAMSMIGQLGPLAGMAGAGLSAGSDSEVLLTMLKSRRVQDEIIAKHQLTKGKEGELSIGQARIKLTMVTTTSLSLWKRIITISVKDESPEKAAAIANDYVAELERLSRELALSKASRTRAFVETQLNEASSKLQMAEEAMKKSQETSGLVQLEEQGKAVIEAIATLQAEIAAKEVELGALKLSATDDNPGVIRAVAILAQMRTQLASLERDNPDDKNPRSLFITTSKAPEAGLEYARRLRDLKFAETINQLLAQQYQMAKVEEAETAPILQVLDAAIPPEIRSSPNRITMVLTALVASSFTMCFFAFVLEAKHQAEEDPEISDKMTELKNSLWSV